MRLSFGSIHPHLRNAGKRKGLKELDPQERWVAGACLSSVGMRKWKRERACTGETGCGRIGGFYCGFYTLVSAVSLLL